MLKPEQGSEYLHASKEIARLLHERDDVEPAKTALREAIDKYPEAVSSEGKSVRLNLFLRYARSLLLHTDVNLLLELLLGLGQSEEALEVLCQHAGVKFASDTLTPEGAEQLPAEQQLAAFDKVLFASVRDGAAAAEPVAVPIEIRTKLIIVLINLRATHLVKV